MKIWIAVVLLFTSLQGWTGEATPLAEDPAVEQRLVRVASELRCLVCQNESLADSQADLAQDLRREIRAQIKAGQSDEQIMEFLVSRYGDFVRYRPAFKPLTLVLWLGPFVLLLLALYIVVRVVRGHRAMPIKHQLNEQQRQQAQALLQEPESRA